MSAGLADDLKHARFLGHPIHMMIVHFPTGLWPFSFVLDLAGKFTGDANFAVAAFYCMAGGIAGALAAATFGAVDFFALASGHKGWKTAMYHAVLNVTWLILWVVLWAIRLRQYPNVELASIGLLLGEAVAVIGLMISSHLGGELILRHHVGIIDTPDGRSAEIAG